MYQHKLPYKSKPERQIAGLLDRYNIPFIYEKPTAVVDGGHTKLWHPDFTLAHGPIIEYFGINGDQSYRDRTAHKMKVYEQNQFELIPLFPPNMRGPWQNYLLSRIDAALENRLTDYRSRTFSQGARF